MQFDMRTVRDYVAKVAMAKGSAPGERRGGRQKGTPNKITFDLIESLRAKGFEPAAKLVEVHAEAMKLYKDKIKNNKGWGAGPALDTACKAASELMQYVYPKRKSVELSGADGQDLFQSLTDVFKQVALGAEKKEQ